MSAAQVLKLVSSVPMPHIDGRDAFVAYLKFAHGIMRATSSLLALAAHQSRNALHDFYVAKLEEEEDHADWLDEDIKLLGETPSRIDHGAAATAGAQYYYLHHVGPQALLGYMAALEFRPMPLEGVEALEKLYGAPALRTVRHHAVADIEHAKALAAMIDQHDEFAALITYNAFITAKMCAFYLADRMKGAAHGIDQ